jgi:hypothetical protein
MIRWELDLPLSVWRYLSKYLQLCDAGKIAYYASSLKSLTLNKYKGPLFCTDLTLGLKLMKYLKRAERLGGIKNIPNISHIHLSKGIHELPEVDTVMLTMNPIRKMIIDFDVIIIGTMMKDACCEGTTTLSGGVDVRGTASITLNQLRLTNPFGVGLTIGSKAKVSSSNLIVENCKKSGVKMETSSLVSSSSSSSKKMNKQPTFIASCCSFNNNGEHGLFINGGLCAMTNCKVLSNKSNGISLRSKGLLNIFEKVDQIFSNDFTNNQFCIHSNVKFPMTCWGSGSVVNIRIGIKDDNEDITNQLMNKWKRIRSMIQVRSGARVLIKQIKSTTSTTETQLQNPLQVN